MDKIAKIFGGKMKRLKQLGSCFGLMVIIFGCSKADPVASDYKQKLSQSEPTPVVAASGNQTPAVPAAKAADKKPAGAIDLVALGTTTWNSKCQSCHGALAVTNKLRSVTNGKDVVEAKATQASHGNVAWPADTEAEAISKVLNP